ncbi:hypothetical protein CRE_04193 [Caenorhabditis remanei]|uniref:F-box domain-containing protein n=1 Tax=Caenorhabditis remanei TaxID=31234 RepID=E3MYY0_CAERE|nr:hypothetical protein CRE_04193 [Caenorhabditis remanei]
MSKVSKPLPLFRLPTLLLTKIIRYMDLQEILLISLASKKSGFIMRSLLPRNWFNLKLLFYIKETEIVLGAKGPWAPVRVKYENGGDLFKLQITQRLENVFYQWAGPQLQDPVKLLLTHFATVFNPTISIYFGDICNQEFVMDVLPLLKQLNLSVKVLKFWDAQISPETYKYVLDEYREVSELWLFCKISSDFEYRAGPDFRVDNFRVGEGHWMHLEDFVNCKEVAVYNHHQHKQPKYANLEEPRALIRKWIESECQLELFTVSSFPDKFDFRLVLQGQGLRTIEQTFSSHSVEIIRRSDGKKALVTCKWGFFELKVID